MSRYLWETYDDFQRCSGNNPLNPVAPDLATGEARCHLPEKSNPQLTDDKQLICSPEGFLVSSLCWLAVKHSGFPCFDRASLVYDMVPSLLVVVPGSVLLLMEAGILLPHPGFSRHRLL